MRAEPSTRPPASNGHQGTTSTSAVSDAENDEASGEVAAGPTPARSGDLTATNSHGKPASAPLDPATER